MLLKRSLSCIHVFISGIDGQNVIFPKVSYHFNNDLYHNIYTTMIFKQSIYMVVDKEEKTLI